MFGRLLAVVVALMTFPAAARAEWLSLRSDHFQVIGNAGERQLKDVALRFEQFRDVVSRLNPGLLRDESAPPVVVTVFRDARSFAPFMPRVDGTTVPVTGYFQPGEDVNYIALSLDGGDQAYPAIFHEFSHLLIRGVLADAPLWFGEGLAEYDSTFEVTANGKRANIGKPVAGHVALLREFRLPFQKFFTIDRTSPEYTKDTTDRAVLYAQSWAILHHAFHGDSNRREQLLSFVMKQAAGGDTARSFREAYGIDMRELENEVQRHVQSRQFRFTTFEFADSITRHIDPVVTKISDAEADARLGDLLVHMGRTDQAVTLLEKAIAADGDLALAHVSLGNIRLRQGRTGDGLAHFRKAVEQHSDNETVYFTYASGLLYQNSMDAEATRLAAGALRRAIELRPGYSTARLLLALVYFRGGEYAPARDLLAPLVRAEPANHEAALWLAESLLELEDFAGARSLLNTVHARATDDVDRNRARALLADTAGREATRDTGAAARPDRTRAEAQGSPDRAGGGFRLELRAAGAGEQRTYGTLDAIECGPTGIALLVRGPDGTVRARAESMAAVEFITYRTLETTAVSCGPQSPRLEVYLTWRGDPTPRAGPPGDAIAIALEVLPPGFVP